MNRRRATLDVIDSTSLEQLLEVHRADGGRIECRICSSPVSIETIAAVARMGDDTVVVCRRPHCLQTMIREVRAGTLQV